MGTCAETAQIEQMNKALLQIEKAVQEQDVCM